MTPTDELRSLSLCAAKHCPSWPFRLGRSPWKAPKQLSDEQREALRERGRALARRTANAASDLSNLLSAREGTPASVGEPHP